MNVRLKNSYERTCRNNNMNSRRRIGKLEPVSKLVINDFGLKSCMFNLRKGHFKLVN